ncbi:MAG: DUF3261 domain-containing protein, partial [Bdellovibrionota bacterium]|nr:DUF3261 domain-containing protein [Bdellovibrionota bacterium]
YYSKDLWLKLDSEQLKLSDFREVQDFKVKYGDSSFRSTAVIQSKNDVLDIHVLSPMGISLLEAELVGRNLKVKKNDLLPKEFKSDYLLMDFLWIRLSKDKLESNSSQGFSIREDSLGREIFFKGKLIAKIRNSTNGKGQREIHYKNIERSYEFHISILQEGFHE